VSIQTPWVGVDVGPVVRVQTPWFGVAVARTPRMPAQPAVYQPREVVPEVVLPPGVRPPEVVLPRQDLTPLPPQQPQLVRAPTLREFADSFTPRPGNYEVVVTHPCTGCPVKVCFTLKGCPKRLRVNSDEIVFIYGLCDRTHVKFCRNGSVQVTY
jgi:hypothetical protein